MNSEDLVEQSALTILSILQQIANISQTQSAKVQELLQKHFELVSDLDLLHKTIRLNSQQIQMAIQKASTDIQILYENIDDQTKQILIQKIIQKHK